jgi:uncharacterized protein YdeI (YjbR/CyaY-like superfamily)
VGKRDPRVDEYIERSAPFARPVLTHIRDIVHAACPDVEETIKWSFPVFTYHGMLCNMASFKEHCTFGFRKSALVLGTAGDESAMGQFGRLTSVKDLPSKRVLTGCIRKAMKLNESGVKAPARSKTIRRVLETPPDLAAALGKNRKARAAFDGFSPSHRNEYIEWIEEAKTDATRQRRLATTLEWLAEGKGRNWKYERKRP